MSDSATVKETSSNMQSPQNATANQSTTKTKQCNNKMINHQLHIVMKLIKVI